MSSYGNQLLERAEAFVRQLFHAYLEERDFDRFLQMLHPDITWFGTGTHEVCRSHAEAEALLAAERASWDGHFRILQCWTQTSPLSEHSCTVFGEMQIEEEGAQALLMKMNTRFSLVCTLHEGEITLHHAHYSVPNTVQGEGEFVNQALLSTYNDRLETALQERTAQLAEKTLELERMANGISGGLQLCAHNDDFTILYVNDGFFKLTGYTREELLDTPHIRLVYPADVPILRAQMTRQLESGSEFSVVYRIVRKDGDVRWVLDNGSFRPNAGNEAQMQRFLTDITVQKLQEEELSVSKTRYEVALQQLDVSMFEYNIATRQLTLYEKDASLYGVSTVIENGPSVLAESGYFDPDSVPGYLEMYRKIVSGEEAVSSCFVTAHDVDDKTHEFELTLTAVLDESGLPIRAIGVKRHASHLRRLQREQEFGKTMTDGRNFICEANLSTDCMLRIDAAWRRKLGLVDAGSYSQAALQAMGNYIAPENRDYLLERLGATRLISLLEQNRHLDHFSFQKTDSAGKPAWHEITVNVIRDETSGDACVRVYHEDISERKRKESQAIEERHLYESMVSKAMVAYELNVSRDTAMRGHEHWREQYGIETNSCYSSMIEAFAQQGMDPRDSGRFLAVFGRQQVLQDYYGGRRELSCQYRKRAEAGGFLWVECTLHLFEDPDSGDICGYSYVENIDKQKRSELALRYQAEHDTHTGLYNKTTTADLIRRYLKSPEGKQGLHAFLMVDLDHFKTINDRFGHLFGDHVIAEMGGRIHTLFRDDDIVGRIGGDEFCVFMKQATSAAAVAERADTLCRALRQRYGEGACECIMSASVGVALYPGQGRSFEELYRRADSALYEAKHGGRSCYALAE